MGARFHNKITMIAAACMNKIQKLWLFVISYGQKWGFSGAESPTFTA